MDAPRSGDGWRALHLAALHGHANVVDLLLEHGADPSATEATGCFTPFHMAVDAEFVRDEMLKLEQIRDKTQMDADALEDKKQGELQKQKAEDKFWKDCEGLIQNRLRIIRSLLRKARPGDVNIPLDRRDENGEIVHHTRPLHMAARIHKYELALCLIEEGGADVDAISEDCMTPLQIAVDTDNFEVGRSLWIDVVYLYIHTSFCYRWWMRFSSPKRTRMWPMARARPPCIWQSGADSAGWWSYSSSMVPTPRPRTRTIGHPLRYV